MRPSIKMAKGNLLGNVGVCSGEGDAQDFPSQEARVQCGTRMDRLAAHAESNRHYSLQVAAVGMLFSDIHYQRSMGTMPSICRCSSAHEHSYHYIKPQVYSLFPLSIEHSGDFSDPRSRISTWQTRNLQPLRTYGSSRARSQGGRMQIELR